MEKVISILFEIPINGKPLFKNQKDLVDEFLHQPGTGYYVEPGDIEKYNLIQNRLKAYISQLLSPTVIRNISGDFEEALRISIQKKTDDPHLTRKLVSEIIDQLKSKKTQKTDPPPQLLDQLTTDFKNGRYISIITSRPLEVDAEISREKYSLRKLVFEDFIDSIGNPNRPLKEYRFNFPVDSSGNLLWKGLHKLLIRHLKNIDDKESFINAIQSKISIKIEANADLFSQPSVTDTEIHTISEHILKALRRECKLVVFTCDAPIFALPLIVIDPAETKNAKVYAITDSEGDDFNVYKFSNQEIVLWRLFVWDKIKSQLYCGKPLEFERI